MSAAGRFEIASLELRILAVRYREIAARPITSSEAAAIRAATLRTLTHWIGHLARRTMAHKKARDLEVSAA